MSISKTTLKEILDNSFSKERDEKNQIGRENNADDFEEIEIFNDKSEDHSEKNQIKNTDDFEEKCLLGFFSEQNQIISEEKNDFQIQNNADISNSDSNDSISECDQEYSIKGMENDFPYNSAKINTDLYNHVYKHRVFIKLERCLEVYYIRFHTYFDSGFGIQDWNSLKNWFKNNDFYFDNTTSEWITARKDGYQVFHLLAQLTKLLIIRDVIVRFVDPRIIILIDKEKIKLGFSNDVKDSDYEVLDHLYKRSNCLIFDTNSYHNRTFFQMIFNYLRFYNPKISSDADATWFSFKRGNLIIEEINNFLKKNTVSALVLSPTKFQNIFHSGWPYATFDSDSKIYNHNDPIILFTESRTKIFDIQNEEDVFLYGIETKLSQIYNNNYENIERTKRKIQWKKNEEDKEEKRFLSTYSKKAKKSNSIDESNKENYTRMECNSIDKVIDKFDQIKLRIIEILKNAKKNYVIKISCQDQTFE